MRASISWTCGWAPRFLSKGYRLRLLGIKSMKESTMKSAYQEGACGAHGHGRAMHLFAGPFGGITSRHLAHGH